MGEIATFLTLRKKKLPITTLPIFPLKVGQRKCGLIHAKLRL